MKQGVSCVFDITHIKKSFTSCNVIICTDFNFKFEVVRFSFIEGFFSIMVNFPECILRN